MEVNKMLINNFPEIMNYKFTANMEKELDDIADGNIKLKKCLDNFWNMLRPSLENVKTEIN